MNQFQLHKLRLAINDKLVPKETQTLIRLLMVERAELLDSIERIRKEAAHFVERVQEIK